MVRVPDCVQTVEDDKNGIYENGKYIENLANITNAEVVQIVE